MTKDQLPKEIYYYKCRHCSFIDNVTNMIKHYSVAHNAIFIPDRDLIIATYKLIKYKLM